MDRRLQEAAICRPARSSGRLYAIRAGLCGWIRRSSIALLAIAGLPGHFSRRSRTCFAPSGLRTLCICLMFLLLGSALHANPERSRATERSSMSAGLASAENVRFLYDEMRQTLWKWRKGNTSARMAMLAQGLNPDLRDEFGQSLIMFSTRECDLETIKELVENPVRIVLDV